MKKYFYCLSFSLLIQSVQMAPTTTSTAVPTTPDNDNNILVRLPEELVTPNNKGWEVYLSDHYTACNKSTLEWANTTMVPTWINGSYVKNGPGRRIFPPTQFVPSSYLDSWAKLHKFTFSNGSVEFSCAMVGTSNYNTSVKTGTMTPSLTIAHTQPSQWTTDQFSEMVANGNDNTNMMVWRLGPEDDGQYLAVGDFQIVQELDMEYLTVKNSKEFDEKSIATSAHWRREVGANSSINFHIVENDVGGINFTLFRFNNTYEDNSQIGTFALPTRPLVHMISNTQNYAVIVIPPVNIDFQAITHQKKYPVDTTEKLNENAKIYLMNLRDGTVMDGFEVDNTSLAFATHHVNAWEDAQDVVLDIVTMTTWDPKDHFMDLDRVLHHPETNDVAAKTVVKRITLNLVTNGVTVKDWPNKQGDPILTTMDYPVINQNYVGIKNQYVYGTASVDFWKQTLIKKDLEDSSKDKTWSKPSHYPGEMFFIPNPENKSEDDGVVVVVVFDGEQEQSYLLLLDGKSFSELNHAYLPEVVPYSFHGNWFPALH